jgi:MinD-like ATPase involved in chromosome partitioning or flagellar assembly
MSQAISQNGRVITFYSYKGGTGRSLLVANTALMLASNGRKVLVIDWDLEAPGLHHYFGPFMDDPTLSESPGLIDLLTSYWDALVYSTTAPEEERIPKGWEESFLDIYSYAVTLRLPGGEAMGKIVLVPAGRQSAAYSAKVSNFDWDAFYSGAGGRGLLDALRAKMVAEFDYILIDSRTGVSDTSGICTAHFPDDLVVCFTYNNQNVLGGAGIAQSASALRNAMQKVGEVHGLKRERLRVFPVPTRVSRENQRLLEKRQVFAWEKFAWSVTDYGARAAEEYWLPVEQPYEADQSYMETFAFLTSHPGDPKSLLSAIERIVAKVTDGTVVRWIPIFNQSQLTQLRLDVAGTDSPVNGLESQIDDAPLLNDESIDLYWPVIARLLKPGVKDRDWGIRTVPASALGHLHEKVDDMLGRGLLLTRKNVGGSRTLALSSLALCSIDLIRAKAEANASSLAILYELESRAALLRTSSNDGSSYLPESWLDTNDKGVTALRQAGFLTISEEALLAASVRNVRTQELKRHLSFRWALAATLALMLIFAGWGLNSHERTKESDARAKKLDELNITQAETSKALILAQQKELSAARLAEEQAKQLTEQTKKTDQYFLKYGGGHSAIADRQYKQAISDFTEAVALQPDSRPDVYRSRASAYEGLLREKPNLLQEERQEYISLLLKDYETWASQSQTLSRYLYAARRALIYKHPTMAVEQLGLAARAAQQYPLSMANKKEAVELVNQLYEDGALKLDDANALGTGLGIDLIKKTPKKSETNGDKAKASLAKPAVGQDPESQGSKYRSPQATSNVGIDSGKIPLPTAPDALPRVSPMQSSPRANSPESEPPNSEQGRTRSFGISPSVSPRPPKF